MFEFLECWTGLFLLASRAHKPCAENRTCALKTLFRLISKCLRAQYEGITNEGDMNMWNEKNSITLAAFFLAIGFAQAGNFVREGISENRKFGRIVSVRGLAERLVESNEASWTMQFSLADADLLRLNNKVKEVQKNIQAYVEEQGFKGEEIEKNPVKITDRSADSYDGKEFKERYVARGGFIINSKKVKQLANMSVRTEDLVKRGVVLTSSHLKYFFTELNAVKPMMIREATANAKAAAQSFAADTNSKLGEIRNASQGLFSIGAPRSEYDSESSSFMKNIRVVTSVDFFLN